MAGKFVFPEVAFAPEQPSEKDAKRLFKLRYNDCDLISFAGVLLGEFAVNLDDFTDDELETRLRNTFSQMYDEVVSGEYDKILAEEFGETYVGS